MKILIILLISATLTGCASLKELGRQIGSWQNTQETSERSVDDIINAFGLDNGPSRTPDAVQLYTVGRNFTNLTVHTTLNVGEDADPDVSNDGKWLLFSSTRSGLNHNIYMNELGTQRITQLTQDPHQNLHPKFSPDGRSITFASNRHDGQFDIYVLPLFDRHGKRIHATPIQITNNGRNNLHPTWSPDGNHLVYCSYNTRGETWELWIYSHIEKSNTMIGYGLLPSWSPDGRHIAYQKFRNRDKRFASIWICDPDGGNPSEIVGDRDYGAITPSWSPDGRFLAYATVHRSAEARREGRINRGDDIWYIPAIGGTPVQVTQFEGVDSQPSWKIDRHGVGRIFFISTREYNLPKIWSAVPFTPEDVQVFD